MAAMPSWSRALVSTAVVVLGAGLHACGEPAPAPPSIVLITLDTTRADHLGCYGYFRDTSPFLDSFAASSIVFDRCIVPMATTLPSHTSILTATYPLEHGVLANLQHTGDYFAPSESLTSFAVFCRQAGLSTAAFVSAAPLKSGSGIETGFDRFDQPGEKQNQRSAGDTNAKVFEWLPEVAGKPFFLWVHYYDPHWPFEPPPEYAGRFATDERLEAWVEERAIPRHVSRPLTGEVDDAFVVRNLYDAEIRYMDDQIAALFERLRALPGFDRAVVLIAGDHGEGLCQHGQSAHGATWDEQVHAPMMLRVPGEAPRRVPWVCSVVDALPTLLGRTGARGFEAFLEQATGRDVLASGFEPRPALSQDTGRQLGDPRVPSYRYSLTTDRWKLVRTEPNAPRDAQAAGAPADLDRRREIETLGYAGDGEGVPHVEGLTYGLFDLRLDPHELRDVAASHPEVVDELGRRLAETLEAQRERARALGSTGHRAASREIQDQVRGLGYVGDGGGD